MGKILRLEDGGYAIHIVIPLAANWSNLHRRSAPRPGRSCPIVIPQVSTLVPYIPPNLRIVIHSGLKTATSAALAECRWSGGNKGAAPEQLATNVCLTPAEHKKRLFFPRQLRRIVDKSWPFFTDTRRQLRRALYVYIILVVTWMALTVGGIIARCGGPIGDQ